jgi:N-formylglutamate amidohydrolase
MSATYTYHRGASPLLISIPHAGTELPKAILQRLSRAARTLPDTDWHVPRLYEFACALRASIVQAEFSRYVVDLNRPPDDVSLYPGQATTGLCPDSLFDGTPLYVEGEAPSEEEVTERCERYWRPYHDKLSAELERIRREFGYALLYDAHSIATFVPRLFAGRLPELNLGSAGGRSCAPRCQQAIEAVMTASGRSYAVNGRFVGGYITRRYGHPAEGVHAVQMELAQSSYMDEVAGFPYNEPKARELQQVLGDVLLAFMSSIKS